MHACMHARGKKATKQPAASPFSAISGFLSARRCYCWQLFVLSPPTTTRTRRVIYHDMIFSMCHVSIFMPLHFQEIQCSNFFPRYFFRIFHGKRIQKSNYRRRTKCRDKNLCVQCYICTVFNVKVWFLSIETYPLPRRRRQRLQSKWVMMMKMLFRTWNFSLFHTSLLATILTG